VSTTELIVVVAGLGFGYLVVSALLGGKSRQAAKKEVPPEHQYSWEQAVPLPPLWHEVLEISEYASTEDIRDAYRRLISQYHPDKVATLGADLRELAVRKSQEINAAYDAALAARGQSR
jgi:DnaJ like chaperone protein